MHSNQGLVDWRPSHSDDAAYPGSMFQSSCFRTLKQSIGVQPLGGLAMRAPSLNFSDTSLALTEPVPYATDRAESAATEGHQAASHHWRSSKECRGR